MKKFEAKAKGSSGFWRERARGREKKKSQKKRRAQKFRYIKAHKRT